jgi:hypothetical protein
VKAPDTVKETAIVDEGVKALALHIDHIGRILVIIYECNGEQPYPVTVIKGHRYLAGGTIETEFSPELALAEEGDAGRPSLIFS